MNFIDIKYTKYNVESLEFVLAQFLLVFVGSHEFKSATKTNFEITETENRRIHKITSPQISEKPIIHEN